MTRPVALGLFSGGLDSILACRVVAEQGVRVVALKFVTPFADSYLLDSSEEYVASIRRLYDIDVRVVDISPGYVRLLEAPVHGFGKHFNPCIDCKILMLAKAREMMAEYGAQFLISGEVLGQRPMSQRRDTLRVIERDSGCTGLLLRPLSALLMEPTRAEQQGLVKRELLHGFSGRGRRQQKMLAAHYGIHEYPAPAGGCLLTDPNLASRIKHFYQGLFDFQSQQIVDDVRLLTLGRHFKLGESLWFIVGREEKENQLLESLRSADDCLVRMTDRPGPMGLLRHGQAAMPSGTLNETLFSQLAGIVVRYGKKLSGAQPPAEVMIDCGGSLQLGVFPPLTDTIMQHWRI